MFECFFTPSFFSSSSLPFLPSFRLLLRTVLGPSVVRQQPAVRPASFARPPSFIWIIEKYDLYLSTRNQGLMAERLGRGLQNLVQRFDSASDLTKNALQLSVRCFYLEFVRRDCLMALKTGRTISEIILFSNHRKRSDNGLKHLRSGSGCFLYNNWALSEDKPKIIQATVHRTSIFAIVQKK